MPEDSVQPILRHSILNEIVAIILLATGILLALCLFTFSPNDASLNTASDTPTHNLIGAVGANLASFFLQFIGLTAYFLPFLFILGAWKTFRAVEIYAPTSRIIGLIIFIFAVSSLLGLFGIAPVFDAGVPAGGFLGTLTAHFLAGGLSSVGAGILLLTLAVVAFLLAANASYSYIFGDFKYYLQRIGLFFADLRRRFDDWRTEQKEIAAERTQQRRTYQNQSPLLAGQKVEFSRSVENQPAKVKIDQPEVISIPAFRKPSVFQKVGDFFRRLQEPPPAERHDDDEVEAIEQSPVVSGSKFKKPTVKTSLPIETVAEVATLEHIEPKILNEEREGFTGFSSEATEPRKVKPKSSDFPNERKNKNEFGERISGSLIRESLLESENPLPADSFEGETESPDELPPEKHKPFSIATYNLPTSDFLTQPPPKVNQAEDELLDIAKQLTEKCKEFKVSGKVVNICPGPIVTTYEYKLDAGIKLAQVTRLVDDLSMALKAESMRIDRIPGKAYVGMEVPNPRRDTIYLRDIVESKPFRESDSLLTIALGKAVDGTNFVTDLAKMPHLLIAGATGAGKSVGVNSLIVSILYKARPDQVKFIMVDPKQVELGIYRDIPHLATPIITDPQRAAVSLKWAVAEMERRYKQLASWGVRNLSGFNTEVVRRNSIEEFDENGEAWKPLPHIVIIIDEFADLMLVARKEVEESVTRLAQMARAVGIHLVLATQRPSTDVITGIIKANFPSRVAYRVSVSYDSRTIIDTVGAENLLGRGDMLFLMPGSRLVRVHGAFVDEKEIVQIVNHVKEQASPDYDDSITKTDDESAEIDIVDENRDELFEDALRICVEMRRASTSVLQRRLSIGYGRAAKIIDAMEREGFVDKADGASKPRKILGKGLNLSMIWTHAKTVLCKYGMNFLLNESYQKIKSFGVFHRTCGKLFQLQYSRKFSTVYSCHSNNL